MRTRATLASMVAGLLLACALLTPGSAQEETLSSTPRHPGEFHFARVIYTDSGMRPHFGDGW